MKSKFKYVGQLTLIFILALLSLSLPFLFTLENKLTIKDNLLWFLYFELLFIITIIFLWRKVLTEVIEIEILNKEIVLKNIVTRRTRLIYINEIAGFRNSIWSGAVSFKDKNDKILFRINDHYYKNFKEIIKKIDKPYLGKEKGIFGK